MNSKSIDTVGELIEKLKKYPSNTEIGHLTGDKNNIKYTKELYLIETNQIGDRDTEEELLLVFANNPDPFNF